MQVDLQRLNATVALIMFNNPLPPVQDYIAAAAPEGTPMSLRGLLAGAGLCLGTLALLGVAAWAIFRHDTGEND